MARALPTVLTSGDIPSLIAWDDADIANGRNLGATSACAPVELPSRLFIQQDLIVIAPAASGTVTSITWQLVVTDVRFLSTSTSTDPGFGSVIAVIEKLSLPPTVVRLSDWDNSAGLSLHQPQIFDIRGLPFEPNPNHRMFLCVAAITGGAFDAHLQSITPVVYRPI